MKVYGRLLKYLEPYKLVFGASLAALTVGALLDGFTMILLIPFLRALFGEAAVLPEAGALVERVIAATVGGFIDKADAGDALRAVILVILVGILIKNVFFYVGNVLAVKVQLVIVRDMRNALYAHIQRLPLGYFDRHKTGQLVARVFTDTEKTREIVSFALADLVRHAVSFMAFVSVLFIISWKLALFTLLVVPLFVGFLKPMLGRLRRGFRSAYDSLGELMSMMQETASGARLVKSYGAEEHERDRFADMNHQFYKTALRAERFSLLSSPLSEVLGAAVTIVIVWVGAQLVFGGELTAEAFLAFLTVSLRVQPPLKSLSTFPVRAQASLAAADRFFEVLDIEPEGGDGGRLIPAFETTIAYDDVHFSYEPGVPVLHGVSFEVKKGEVAALVGPSGGGKSTIVDLLPGFYLLDQGSIAIDHTDAREIDLDSLRNLMGIVSQETVIFHDTVRANIAYGATERYSQDQIEQAARAANAHDFISSLLDGYDTVLGDRGVRLSGGQRQRIAIARAILRDPPILILDEATSSLDSESERLVQQAIERLLANRTVIVIAHRLSTVQGADQILVVADGRIVESGRHEELVLRGGLYRRLHEMQLTRESDLTAEPPSSDSSSEAKVI